MLKTCAVIFGVIMLIVGILGFIPRISPNHLLFGLFHINFVHNLIHIVTGVISILCGVSSEEVSRLFFQIFGIIYGLIAILGFYYVDRPVFGVIANNMADAILHVVIAVITLYLGFVYRYPEATP